MGKLKDHIKNEEWSNLLDSVMPGGSNWHKAMKREVNCLDECVWKNRCKGNGPGNYICSEDWRDAEDSPIVINVLFHVINNWDYYNQKDLKGITEYSESVKELRQFVSNLYQDGTFEVDEGGLSVRTHIYRERNSAAAKKLKKKALEAKCVTCSGCKINYYDVYGNLAISLIECHHLIPLSSAKHTGTTKSSELALLCANCHRLVHSRREPLTLDELHLILVPKNGKAGQADTLHAASLCFRRSLP